MHIEQIAACVTNFENIERDFELLLACPKVSVRISFYTQYQRKLQRKFRKPDQRWKGERLTIKIFNVNNFASQDVYHDHETSHQLLTEESILGKIWPPKSNSRRFCEN